MSKALRQSGQQTAEYRAKLRILNDNFRRTFNSGVVVMTTGVAALDDCTRAAVLQKMRDFDAFDDDNDPWGEHDFIAVEHNGETIFGKIDLYERTAVKHYSIAKPLFVSVPPAAGRRFRIVRSWPCASAHPLVSGESASILFPQSVFTYAESPKA
jgi:Protein of unknown function (DUF3768)